MSFLIAFLLIIIALWLVTILFLRGEDLGRYDRDDDSGAVRSFAGRNGPSKEHGKCVESIREFGQQARRMSKQERLDSMRRFMEELPEGREFTGEFVPGD
jgi:hypothetical protein